MDEIPQEIVGSLRNNIQAGLLRAHSRYLEQGDLTECLREAYDVYARGLQHAGWPLTEILLAELIPAWVFQWGVAREWLPYPPVQLVAGRRDRYRRVIVRSSYQPIPEAELTVQFGSYKVTDWYKADVLKRLASRIAFWQAAALVTCEGGGTATITECTDAAAVPEDLVLNCVATGKPDPEAVTTRLPSTVTSHAAARQMEAYLTSNGIGQTAFANSLA